MIPAFYNGFVSGMAREAYFNNERRLSSGTVVKSQVACRTGYVRRLNYTSNPIKYVKGKLPFREPSSYTRVCSIWEPIPCNLTASGGRYRKGVFDITVAAAGSLDVGLVNSDGGCSTLPNEAARADTECLVKLAEGKVSLGQYLVESVRSADMVASAFMGIGGLLLDLKRGRVDSVRRRLGRKSVTKTNAGLYLEWEYGWKPLASDLYTLYTESISTLDNPLMLTATRNVSSHQEYSTYNNVNFDYIEASVDAVNTCKLIARISDSYLHQASSVGLINPLSLGWELVPYSFVFDWICPVGNYFEALTAPAGLVFVGGYRGQRSETLTIGHWDKPSGFSGAHERVRRQGFSYQRSKLGTFPAPQPYGKSPFTTGKVRNALALARNLLR